MKKVMYWISAVTLAAGFFAVLFSSCGSSGGNGSATTGSVDFYLTDDMSTYKQVIATITDAQLLHTGTGAACVLLDTPVTVNVAELANVLQLVNVSQCPAVPYNRMHIEFTQSVQLMDMSGTSSLCAFASYKDEGNQPNVLQCGGSTCTLDINGAVTVFANQQNKLALDFDLKNFDVEQFSDPANCSVTMKVSPLHANEIELRGHPEGVTGLISGLSTTDRTFSLTRGGKTFSVLYSSITPSWQPGIDNLLQVAQTDSLRVKVMSSGIDFSSMTIAATTIYVKTEGRVSNLNETARTFTLTSKEGVTITVDYSTAGVQHALVEGAWVELQLYGFDDGHCLASSVESGTEGVSTGE